MNFPKVLASCVLGLAPGLVLAVPLTITSMPTDSVSEPGTPFRHNVFHDATVPGGAGGDVLAWFGLDSNFTSTWDPTTGALELYVNVYQDAAHTTLLGTATGLSGSLNGADFGIFDNSTLGFIEWVFNPGAAAQVGTDSLTMEFINHNYAAASNSAGNIPNSYVNNTVTLWGADGVHNGNGFFNDASLGVDMVFTVGALAVPEPTVLILMAMGLLGLGFSARKLK